MAADLRPTAPDPAVADSIDLRRCRVVGKSPEAAGPRDRRVDVLGLEKNEHFFKIRFNLQCQ